MRVLAVANQKGGCGKTTTAISLSACLAFLGKRVLLVDLDSQGHASLGLGITPEELDLTLYDVLSPRVDSPPDLASIIVKLSPNLHLIPSDLTLAALEQDLSGVPGRERRLSDAFASIGKAYDYVFIDCAPGLGILSFNALQFAGEVLVPVECSLFSLHGLARFIETVRVAEEGFNKQFVFHALITNYDNRTRMARRYYGEIREYLDDIALKTAIRRNVRLADAATHGKPITEFDRNCTGYQDYMACTTELIERAQRSPALASETWEMSAAASVEPIEVARVAERIAAEASEELEPDSPEPIEPEPLEPEPLAVPLPEPMIESEPETPAEVTVAVSSAGEETDDETEPAPATIEELRFTPPAEPLPMTTSAALDHSRSHSQSHSRSQSGPPSGGFKLGELMGDLAKPVIEIKLEGPVRSSDGILFAVSAPKAKTVKIAGEFNDWRPEKMEPSIQGESVWQVMKKLNQGTYRYKFIVNGEWINDPHNTNTMANPFGGHDSVVNVRS